MPEVFTRQGGLLDGTTHMVLQPSTTEQRRECRIMPSVPPVLRRCPAAPWERG